MSELLKPRVLRNENSAFRPGSDKRNNVRKITDLSYRGSDGCNAVSFMEYSIFEHRSVPPQAFAPVEMPRTTERTRVDRE
ncbi:hypothetical protein AC579_9302 [Pseudocercospora musae]|uniref:Uncharacterized protein n=1 Tax=Pseudocercospora musae TaxID=113226 RepID=A0A139I509_9PEZI|nr:hypothetical protein AC579_9302 [Pseudocercospora musae]